MGIANMSGVPSTVRKMSLNTVVGSMETVGGAGNCGSCGSSCDNKISEDAAAFRVVLRAW